MNKLKVLAAAATMVAMSLAAMPALAQGPTGGPGGPGGFRGGGQRPDPVARLTTALNLNAHQQAEIHKIFEADMPKMRSFGRGQEAQPQREALMKSMEAQVMQVLTPAQQNKVRAAGGLRGLMGRGRGGGRLERALQGINLNPGQKKKIDAIMEDSSSKARAIFGSNAPDDQKRAEMKKNSDAHKEAVMAVLNPDQRKAFQHNLDSMPAPGQGRGGRGRA